MDELNSLTVYNQRRYARTRKKSLQKITRKPEREGREQGKGGIEIA